MKNLLTKILFISLLLSAAVPSNVQASWFTNAKNNLTTSWNNSAGIRTSVKNSLPNFSKWIGKKAKYTAAASILAVGYLAYQTGLAKKAKNAWDKHQWVRYGTYGIGGAIALHAGFAQHIEKFLGTKSGNIVAQLLILAGTIYGTGHAMEKAFSKLSGGSKINRYKRKEGEKALNFKDDYVGDLPPKIRTVINRILHPNSYSEFGLDQKKGILLCGLPGVGKTWLARVLADEVGVPTYPLYGSELKGGSARGSGVERVKRAFKEARKTKGHAIIVIDELDAISGGRFVSGEADDEALKTFLTEMEGFDTKKNANITVIGLTNSPRKLSPALHRRFDTVKIDLPDKKGRKELLKFYVNQRLKSKKAKECCILKDVNFDALAAEKFTKGFSQDRLESVVKSVFTQVAELESGFRQNRDNHDVALVEGKIEISHKAFETAVKNLKGQIEIGEEDFLGKSDYPMSEAAKRMYS